MNDTISSERQLAEAISDLLDTLDADDETLRPAAGARRFRWPYRRKNFRIDIVNMEGVHTELLVSTRALGAKSLIFVTAPFIYPGTTCSAHLFTSYNMWHCVTGRVQACRYVGSRMHEVELAFDREIEVAMFLTEAIERRILVVDDDQISRTLITFHLEELYARVEAVSDYRGALEAFQTGNFDLIMMDIEMPEVDGIGTFKMLRDAGCTAPIIAVTAFTAPDDKQRFTDLGFDGYLPKPVHEDGFRELLDTYTLEPVLSSFMDRDAMRPMIEDFVNELPTRVHALREAMRADDHAQVEVLARKLKADAGGLGFEIINDSAGRLEAACQQKAESTENVSRCIAILIDHCSRARSFHSA